MSKYSEEEQYTPESDAVVSHSCDPTKCDAFRIEGNAELVGVQYDGTYVMTLKVNDLSNHIFTARHGTFPNTDVKITINPNDGVFFHDFELRIPKE